MCNIPLSEYETEGYVVMAFPHLFPKGKADLRIAREIKLTEQAYFSYLMLYKDGRFAKDPRFRYFALNTILRCRSAANVKLLMQRKKLKGITISELKRKIKHEPNFVKNIISFNASIRSTSAFWNLRYLELVDLIKALGPPTFFFTLSAADLFWPELFKLIDPNISFEKMTETEAFRKRQKMVNENPLIVAWFFKEKSEYFFNHFLKNRFKIIDFWYRIEFQHRGSPHIYGVFWCENAPDIAVLNDAKKYADGEISFDIEFYDQFISAEGPNIESNYIKHPSTLKYSEVDNHLLDFKNLLTAVQTHKCNKNYCLKEKISSKSNYKNTKKLKSTETKCRFNFPKKITNKSDLVYDFKKHYFKYEPKRNDPYLNPFDRLSLEQWRANLDFQPILSCKEILFYISKYAAKPESKSNLFKTFLTDFAYDKKSTEENNNCENLNSATIIKKAVNKMIGERDYSAQETFYFIMGFKYYSCSRSFTIVNLEPDNKYISFEDNLENNTEENSILNTKQNQIEIYCSRDKKFENLSLKQFFSRTRKEKGKYILRKQKDSIVRFFPQNVVDKNLEAKVNVISNIPFRNIKDICNDNNWIAAEKKFNLRQNQSEFENIANNYDYLEDSEEQEKNNEFQEEWQIISKTVNSKPIQNVQLGNRDYDYEYNFNKDFDCSPEAIKRYENFIDLEKQNFLSTKNTLENNINLTEEQMKVINILDEFFIKNRFSSFI